MKKIKLTKGKFALVDNEDFEYLSQWKWHYIRNGYAARHSKVNEKERGYIYMHRQINNTPSGLVTDHINRNKLDNRKINLRNATNSMNGMNRNLNKNNSSGYLGVFWRKDRKKWIAFIKVNYKRMHLGNFYSKIDAIKARRGAELSL